MQDNTNDFEEMKDVCVSAWQWKPFRLWSPDGTKFATMCDFYEYGMGSPPVASLKVYANLDVKGCSPSIVWSNDSRYLAAPRITHNRRVELVVADTAAGKIGTLSTFAVVLELHSFKDGLIEGVSSPRWWPTDVNFRLDQVIWD